MGLALAEIEAIRTESFASDVAYDLDQLKLWSEDEVRDYFESGGEAVQGAAASERAAAVPPVSMPPATPPPQDLQDSARWWEAAHRCARDLFPSNSWQRRRLLL